MILTGKVTGINTSDGMFNIAVEDREKNVYNLKISSENGMNIRIAEVYEFDCELDNRDGRVHYNVNSFKNIRDFEYEKKASDLRYFYKSAPMTNEEAEAEIIKYMDKIENKTLKDITAKVYAKFRENFLIYPAATKMHHNYIGGLAYHVIGMLHLADGFLNTYTYLNKDYVYAGIILHDISKTDELTDPIAPSYSDEGQLIGHLVMGAMEVKLAAIELGLENTEECMVLMHMLISHHGMPQFGAAKKPMIAEAMLLWYVDTIDSKFRVMGEELENTESGQFTGQISVIDKTKIYKI